jgi:hypothetical protein
LNQFDETTAHASGTGDLTRLCALVATGRLDGQVELQGSWREPTAALDALLHRRIGGKAVLHVDGPPPRRSRPASNPHLAADRPHLPAPEPIGALGARESHGADGSSDVDLRTLVAPGVVKISGRPVPVIRSS